MGWDTSNLQQKIEIRNSVFQFFHDVSERTVLELFAGTGMLTLFWSRIAKQVISIEQRKEKVQAIQRLGMRNVSVICDDFKNHLELVKEVEIIDCDTYGLVIPILDRIRMIRDDALVFFTDGSPSRAKKLRFMKYDLEREILMRKPRCYHLEKARGGNVFYGYAFWDKSNGGTHE